MVEKSEIRDMEPDEIFEVYESNTTDLRHNRSGVLKFAYDKYQEIGEDEKAQDIRMEIIISDLSTHSYPEKRFDSLTVFTTEDGTEWRYPDLQKDFNDEVIEYYRTRAAITKNPILGSRYYDVIWEIKREVECARRAVDFYLDSCPIYLANEWEHELAESLDRAMSLSVAVNDRTLIVKCLDEHFKYIRMLSEEGRYRYVLDIVRSLLRQTKKIKEPIDWGYLITVIEAAVADYREKEADSFHLQRSFLEVQVDIHNILKDNEKAEEVRAEIAESYIEEADWKKGNYGSGNMVAAHFYEKALQAYVDLGNYSDKVEELKVKITEANEAALETEYKAISSTVPIPTKAIDDYVDIYRGLETDQIFQALSMDPYLIPSYEQEREKAIKQAEEFALSQIFPVAIMKGNICVQHVVTEEERLEYRTISNFRNLYKFIAHIFLSALFEMIENDHPYYSGHLVDFLSSTEIIDKKRIGIIKHGLRAFENKEYVAAIHILVFQIEGVLRDLLGKLGIPTFVHRSRAMRERLLKDVINTLSQVPGIDKDLLKFIDVFLCDIQGDNYRNDIAHGLVSEAEFTRENTLLLILILVKLVPYSVSAPSE